MDGVKFFRKEVRMEIFDLDNVVFSNIGITPCILYPVNNCLYASRSFFIEENTPEGMLKALKKLKAFVEAKISQREVDPQENNVAEEIPTSRKYVDSKVADLTDYKMKNTNEFKYTGSTKWKIDRESFINYLMNQKTKYIVYSYSNGQSFIIQIDFED